MSAAPALLWDALDINNFILFFLILLFFFFILLFFKDDEKGMWQGSHMTGHMMWCHKPRTWWKNLEGDVRAHGVCMVASIKIVDNGLYFLFSLFTLFYFSIFRTTWVRIYQSDCHISHELIAKSQDWSQNLKE